MGKKEFAIGDEFEIDGIRLRCIGQLGLCNGCYFSDKEDFCTREEIVEKTGPCSRIHRKDRTSVVFVKVED